MFVPVRDGFLPLPHGARRGRVPDRDVLPRRSSSARHDEAAASPDLADDGGGNVWGRGVDLRIHQDEDCGVN